MVQNPENPGSKYVDEYPANQTHRRDGAKISSSEFEECGQYSSPEDLPWGWRDGSAVRNVFGSSRGHEFSSRHLSQPDRNHLSCKLQVHRTTHMKLVCCCYCCVVLF